MPQTASYVHIDAELSDCNLFCYFSAGRFKGHWPEICKAARDNMSLLSLIRKFSLEHCLGILALVFL